MTSPRRQVITALRHHRSGRQRERQSGVQRRSNRDGVKETKASDHPTGRPQLDAVEAAAVWRLASCIGTPKIYFPICKKVLKNERILELSMHLIQI
jgi:hypothetical protein